MKKEEINGGFAPIPPQGGFPLDPQVRPSYLMWVGHKNETCCYGCVFDLFYGPYDDPVYKSSYNLCLMQGHLDNYVSEQFRAFLSLSGVVEN